MRKYLDVLAVIHMGHGEDGRVIDDNCPCCGWCPPHAHEGNGYGAHDKSTAERNYHLGEIWHPKTGEVGIGSLFQALQREGCGIVYATHIN